MFRDSHERIPFEEERSNKTENGRMKKVIQRGSIRSTRYKNLFRDCRWSGIDRCNILSYRFFEKIKDLLFLSGAGLGCKREHGRCFVVVSSRDFKSRLTFLQKSGNTLKTRLSSIEKFHKVFRKISNSDYNCDYFIPSSFSDLSFVGHLDFLHSFLL